MWHLLDLLRRPRLQLDLLDLLWQLCLRLVLLDLLRRRLLGVSCFSLLHLPRLLPARPILRRLLQLLRLVLLSLHLHRLLGWRPQPQQLLRLFLQLLLPRALQLLCDPGLPLAARTGRPAGHSLLRPLWGLACRFVCSASLGLRSLSSALLFAPFKGSTCKRASGFVAGTGCWPAC